MIAAGSIDDLKSLAGEDLGASDWLEVTQEGVNAFADATGDHQWIHTDPERARATPFGGTIVHGFFVLSLAARLLPEVLPLDQFAFAMNYGLNRVRFPAPLPVGERIRMRARMGVVRDAPGGASLAVVLTFERPDGDKPVCVAEMLVRVVEKEDLK
jgi:acyl dehydratase